MRFDEEIVEMLEAFDLTGTYPDAAEHRTPSPTTSRHETRAVSPRARHVANRRSTLTSDKVGERVEAPRAFDSTELDGEALACAALADPFLPQLADMHSGQHDRHQGDTSRK